MRKWYKYLLWGIITVSLAFLVFSPLDKVIDEVRVAAPWVVGGFFLTEGMFITGLVLVALSASMSIGNPLKLRGRAKEVLHEAATEVANSRLFWVGFWLNASGAFGSGMVAVVAVMATLPVQSWGISLLAFMDLSATIALRAAVIGLAKPLRTRT